MRELTLLETGYLCGLLLLSLVLPLMMSIRGPRNAVARKYCMRIVWVGQICGVFAAVVVLVSGLVAPYAAALGLVSCMGCVGVLLGQFRAATHMSRQWVAGPCKR